jgi:F-type H+-transporting ATPase subunit delta
MKLELVSRRYAEAFVDYAEETIGLKRAIGETQALRDIIRDNPEFTKLLLAPELVVYEKFEFIDLVLKDYFSQELKQFLKLIIEKKRAAILVNILDYLIANYSREEVIPVQLKSAYPLDAEATEKIESALERKLQKKLQFSVGLDKNLLGGVCVQIGNTFIDGSLKGRLEELRSELKKS